MADQPNSEAIDRHVGANIEARRRQLGLGIDELAERSDLSPHQVRQIEAGEWSVTVDSLWRIAAALDMPISYFVGGKDMPPPPRNVRPEAEALALEMVREFLKIRSNGVREKVVNLVRTTARTGR